MAVFRAILESAHGQFATHIDLAAQSIADGDEHLLSRCLFHQVTVCARAQGSFGENGFLEAGVDQDE